MTDEWWVAIGGDGEVALFDRKSWASEWNTRNGCLAVFHTSDAEKVNLTGKSYKLTANGQFVLDDVVSITRGNWLDWNGGND